jgi:NADH-quinone oxidoreductase subunit F
VLTTLRYFREEYEMHVHDKRCPAGVCTALIHHRILSDKCVGCQRCKIECPVQCITSEKKGAHTIDASACIQCGTCYDVCKFNAVEVY